MKTLPEIKSLNIELTTRCTARCPFCTRILENHTDISDLNFKAIENIPYEKLDIAVVSGCLGEPTCYPRFIETIEYMYDKNPDIEIRLTTNGAAHTPDWWGHLGSFFKEEKKGYAIFGIDGLEDTHSLYRRGTVFKNVINNVKAFNEAGGRSIVQMIIFRHNEHQLYDLKKLSEDIGCKRLFYRPSKMYNDELQRPIMDIRTRSEIVKSLPEGFYYCFMVDRQELYVNVDGYLMPCYVLSNRRPQYKKEDEEFMKKFSEAIPFMDLTKYKFDDIIKQDIFTYILNRRKNLVSCNSVCGCPIPELINYI